MTEDEDFSEEDYSTSSDSEEDEDGNTRTFLSGEQVAVPNKKRLFLGGKRTKLRDEPLWDSEGNLNPLVRQGLAPLSEEATLLLRDHAQQLLSDTYKRPPAPLKLNLTLKKYLF